MKIIIDGMEIEIKVKPAGSKTVDKIETEMLIDELSMVYAHASNFVFGNGMQERAEYYKNKSQKFATAYFNTLTNN